MKLLNGAKARALTSIEHFGATVPVFNIAKAHNVPYDDALYCVDYFIRGGDWNIPREIGAALTKRYEGDRWQDFRAACVGAAEQMACRFAGVSIPPFGG